MVYVSSSCVRYEKIKDSVEELAMNGFRNIELSGGTKYYEGYQEDLLALKEKYKLNYLLHNYFPPPKQDFILNLASLSEDIYQKTFKHYEKAIALSKKLGSGKFGLHAGFFIDFSEKEIGKDISLTKLYNKDEAVKRFCEGYTHLKEKAGDIELFIENNVLSCGNTRMFQGQNPFMLTDHDGYVELETLIDFKLLLDIAHLNVSANSLGFDFSDQLKKMIPYSDYLHLSGNNGLQDENGCFTEDNDILRILKDYDLCHKTVVIEIYDTIDAIKLSQSIITKSLRLG